MALFQIIQATLYVTTSILLFVPVANQWFRSIKHVPIAEK